MVSMAISNQVHRGRPRRTLAGLNFALAAFSIGLLASRLNLRQGRADSKHISFGLQLRWGGTWDFGWCRTPIRQNP